MTALLVLGVATLGAGATALAQGGTSDELSIDFQDGCLTHSRVVVKLSAPDDRLIEELSVRANGREVLRLNGLSGEARMRVRLNSARGEVTVSGQLAGGETFSRSREYRACAPAPEPRTETQDTTPQRKSRPEPTLTGGGEG